MVELFILLAIKAPTDFSKQIIEAEEGQEQWESVVYVVELLG